MLSFFCLREIAATPAGVTTDDLHRRIHAQKATQNNKEHFDIRTLQRQLEEFRGLGVKLAKAGRKVQYVHDENSVAGVMRFLRKFTTHKKYQKLFFGDIDGKRLGDYFANKPGAVLLVYSLLEALIGGRTVNFAYTPQSDLTRLKMESRSKFLNTNRQEIPVTMLPRFLVVSGHSFLVLGEFLEKRSFNRSDFKAPKTRHYELRGIDNLSIGETRNAELAIDPAEIYRNSVHIWSGGEEFEVELEEVWYQGGKPQRRKRKVNGEDEILSLAAGSLGRIKIVNPPPELIKRADIIGLPHDLVFRKE
jgi:hypothetical protein